MNTTAPATSRKGIVTATALAAMIFSGGVLLANAESGDLQVVAAQSDGHYLASSTIGQAVHAVGADGKDAWVGDVNDIVIDENNSATAAVIGLGGVLGLAEREVAVPIATLVRREKDGIDYFFIDSPVENLETAPTFKRTDGTWGGVLRKIEVRSRQLGEKAKETYDKMKDRVGEEFSKMKKDDTTSAN